MKKYATIVALAVFTAFSASAGIKVDYSLSSGLSLVPAPGSSPLVPAGVSALVQLIFTTDANYDSTVNIGPGEIAAPSNASILDTGIVDNSVGNDYGFSWSAIYFDAVFQAGYVFMRVFDTDTPAIGSTFIDGPMIATSDKGAADAAQFIVEGSPAAGGTGEFGTYVLNEVVVPEPATFALMGLGGLALAIRRRLNA